MTRSTALALAAERGSEESVRMLLRIGADPNLHGKYHTALHTAAFHGHADVVRTLLEWSANANTDVGHYGAALDATRLTKRDDIAKILRGHGAVGSPDDRVFNNALVTASELDHKKVVRQLLDNRIDLSIEGEYLNKALSAAAVSGHMRIVQMLLEAGGDTVTHMWDLTSAINAAQDAGHERIVQGLREFDTRQQSSTNSYYAQASDLPTDHQKAEGVELRYQ